MTLHRGGSRCCFSLNLAAAEMAEGTQLGGVKWFLLILLSPGKVLKVFKRINKTNQFSDLSLSSVK